MTIREAYVRGVQQLTALSTTPALDVELLLMFVLRKSKMELAVTGDDSLTQDEQDQLLSLIAKRATGYPIAYITKEKEFYARSFFVDERVLIPRPETELLIEQVLTSVTSLRTTVASSPFLRILDLGTGSGCIAVTLKKEVPSSIVVATDLSTDALAVARLNAKQHNADISFLQGDLFAPLSSETRNRFDIIVSNPPYGDLKQIDLRTKESSSLRFEPRSALTPSGNDAVAIVKQIITLSHDWLTPTGMLLVEIGHDQGRAAHATAHASFPNNTISILKDLAGIDRILSVT